MLSIDFLLAIHLTIVLLSACYDQSSALILACFSSFKFFAYKIKLCERKKTSKANGMNSDANLVILLHRHTPSATALFDILFGPFAIDNFVYSMFKRSFSMIVSIESRTIQGFVVHIAFRIYVCHCKFIRYICFEKLSKTFLINYHGRFGEYGVCLRFTHWGKKCVSTISYGKKFCFAKSWPKFDWFFFQNVWRIRYVVLNWNLNFFVIDKSQRLNIGNYFVLGQLTATKSANWVSKVWFESCKSQLFFRKFQTFLLGVLKHEISVQHGCSAAACTFSDCVQYSIWIFAISHPISSFSSPSLIFASYMTFFLLHSLYLLFALDSLTFAHLQGLSLSICFKFSNDFWYSKTEIVHHISI